MPELAWAWTFLVLPITAIVWLGNIITLDWRKNWGAALFSILIVALIAAFITWNSPIQTEMRSAIQNFEFQFNRASYETIIARTPKSAEPQFVRVSVRDTSAFCCSTQTFEEIWFDERDLLGSGDPVARDKVFWSAHPQDIGHARYSVRALGNHYYFVDIWY